MVLNGPNIEAVYTVRSPPTSPIHNSLVRRRETQATSTIRHNIERETPLPIYLSLTIHTKTRKRELVDDLYELGLSISYSQSCAEYLH